MNLLLKSERKYFISRFFNTSFCFLIFSICSINSFSQEINSNMGDFFFTKLYSDVNVLIEKHINDIQSVNLASANFGANLAINEKKVDSIGFINTAIGVVEKRRIAKDIGLRFSLGYIDNFTNGLEDQGFFYRRAFQSGLDWNLLKDGLLDSRLKAREYGFKEQLTNLQTKNEGLSNEYEYMSNHIFNVFEAAKRRELLSWQSFSSDYLDISKRMFYKKLMLWDDILQLIAQQTIIDNMVEQLANSQDSTIDSREVLMVDSLPVFKINHEQLLAHYIQKKEVDDSLSLIIQDDYLKSKYRAVKDLSLRPYVRYNYYNYQGVNRVASGNRDFMSAGVQFSMPLPMRIKENKSLRELRMKELDMKNANSGMSEINELKNILNEYELTYHRYIEACFEIQIIKEKIRREQVKLKLNDGDYSPIFIVKQVNEFYNKKQVLTNTKKELYLQLLKIKYSMPNVDLSEFAQQINLEKEVDKNKLYEFSTYLWSSTFADLSNESIVNELKNNKCKKLLLSINQDNVLKMKAFELNKLLAKENIELHMMIANNNYIYADQAANLKESIDYVLEIPGIKGIHLDIEPHTIPELKDDRAKYQDLYVAMLKRVKQQINNRGLKLSISIPVFYEKEKLKKMYALVDKVYIMAYENPSVDYITRKTEEERAIDKSKTIIALRTKDFKNKEGMTQFIQQLTLSLGIDELAIYDFKTWILFK